MRRPALIAAAATLVLACGGESSPPQADAGVVDARTADVWLAPDAEPSAVDAAVADAARFDASFDAGAAADGGPPDGNLGCEACVSSGPLSHMAYGML